MAIGDYTDFLVYPEQFFGGFGESLERNFDIFNAASVNTFILDAIQHRGHYRDESFWKTISGLIIRRDIADTTTGATDLELTQGEHTGVKLARAIGPVANTVDSFRKIEQDPAVFSFEFGRQAGEAAAVEMVDTSIKALVAAMSNKTSTLQYDHTSTGDLEAEALNAGLALMGDQHQNIIAWLMHSKVYFDLIGDQLASGNGDNVAGAVAYGATPASLGRPVIVTDNTDMLISGTPDNYKSYGLVAGAVRVSESEDRQVASDLVTGLLNLVMRIQGEYSYTLALKGFAWDKANGGINPDATAVELNTNWDAVATDDKALCGVEVLTT
jgi:hypothetical protein